MEINLLKDSNDLIHFQPKIFGDERGYFVERFNKSFLDKAVGYSKNFVQQNESFSSKGVLRGMHYQTSRPQSKLVTVIEGSVLDVVVDLREDSSTFGKWFSVELNSDLKNSLYIPKGYAHGFYVNSENAIFSYMVDEFYDPDSELTILWNDKDINIEWNIKNPIVSERDLKGISFQSAYKFNSE